MLKLSCLSFFLLPIFLQGQSLSSGDTLTCYRIALAVRIDTGITPVDIMTDELLVYRFRNFIIYQNVGSHSYSTFNSENTRKNYDVKTSLYMISDTTEKEGFSFTGLEDLGWQNIDSFKNELSAARNSKTLYGQLQPVLKKAKPAMESVKPGSVAEVYYLDNSDDSTAKIKLTLTYSRLTDCPITLSPEMDSLKQMKLCSVRFDIPGYFSKKANRWSPPFMMLTSLERLEVAVPEDIKIGFDKYLKAKRIKPVK